MLENDIKTASSPPDRVALAGRLTSWTLLGIAAIYATAYPLNGQPFQIAALIYMVVFYAAIRAGQCIKSESFQPTQLVFWLFTYSVMGIVQIVQFAEDANPFGVVHSDRIVTVSLVALLLGCVAVDIWANARLSSTATRLSRTPRSERTVSVRRTILLSCGTILATPYFISANGGMSALFSSREDVLTHLSLAGGGDIGFAESIPRLASNALPLVALLALLLCRRGGTFRFRNRLELTALLLALIAVNIVLNNPISQPRYWVATCVIALWFVIRPTGSPKSRSLFALTIVFASLVAFPFLDYFRLSGGYSNLNNGPVYYYTNKTDYGTAPDLINAVYYVDQNGIRGGLQITSAILFPIPRSIWESKAPNTRELLAREIGFENLNIDSPLWAEGFVDFGMPGTLIVMSVWGLIVRRLDAVYSDLRNLSPLSIYALITPILVGYQLIILRGSLLQAMGRISLVLLCVALISSSARSYTRPVERSK